jgi:hypothetical protein
MSVNSPPPPEGLLPHVQEAWKRYWASDLAAHVDPASDLPALERLFSLYDEVARSREGPPELRQAGFFFGAEVLELEDRFFITRADRAACGIRLGEA